MGPSMLSTEFAGNWVPVVLTGWNLFSYQCPAVPFEWGVAGGSPGEFTHTSCGRHGGGSENTDDTAVPKCRWRGFILV